MYQIRLLGPVEITRDGTPLRPFETRKAYALLAYLIRRVQPVPRAQLADLLWSTLSEARGRRNLSHALTLLSNALPGCIGSDYHALQYTPSADYQCDAVGFETLTTGDHATGELWSAAALYRGDFLAGLFLDDCPEFETWLVREREYWRAQLTHTLERLARFHAAREQFSDARRALQQWLDVEPWSEDAHRYLMSVFAVQGQRGAALAQFERARKILTEELNAPLSPETVTLYEKIRDGAFDANTAGWDTLQAPPIEISERAPLHNLPTPVSRFIGRTQELDTLAALFAQYRLITLTGAGGSGKTRLALMLGKEVLTLTTAFAKRLYPDGVWLVEFAPLSEPGLVMPTLAELFHVRETAGASLADALTAHLSSRELVLIFDNCEHLIDACAAEADRLLRACPALKIVATSREPLRVPGEKIFLVRPLDLPAPDAALTPDALIEFDGIRFFVERADAVAEFSLTHENAAAVVQICRRLDGIPLALELAAAHVNALPVAEIAAHLNDRFTLLTTGNRTALPRHQTLRALVDWSYQLLSVPERALFRALAVFSGGWTLGAAQAVSGDSGTLTLALLAQLVDKSLVRPDPPKLLGQAPRYQMLETLREYGRAELRAAGQENEVRARHLKFFLAHAQTNEPHLYYGEQLQALVTLEAEHDNFRAALEWGLQHAPADALWLVGALGRFWDIRGHATEGMEWVQRALAHAGVGAPAAARAKAYRFAGGFARSRGEYAAARQWIQASLELYRALDDKPGIAVMLNSTGFLLDFQGEYAAAQEYYLVSQSVYRELGDVWGIAVTTNNLGSVALAVGDAVHARELNNASSNGFRAVGDKRTLAVSLSNEGNAAYQLEDYAGARECCAEALELSRELGETRNVANILYQLALVAVARGELDTALHDFDAALQIFVELHDVREIATVLEGLAELAARSENFLRAARLSGAAEALRARVGTPRVPSMEAGYAETVSTAHARLGDAAFDTARAEGSALKLNQLESALKHW